MLAVATDMTHLRLGIYCFIQNLHYVPVVDGVLLKKYFCAKSIYALSIIQYFKIFACCLRRIM